MFRKLYTLITIGAVLAGGSWLYPLLSKRGDGRQQAPQTTLPAVRPTSTIRIASFNIQVFGETKFADQQVLSTLAKIVRKFDIVAIQEVCAKDPTLVSRFVQLVNSEQDARYDFVIGPRLG